MTRHSSASGCCRATGSEQALAGSPWRFSRGSGRGSSARARGLPPRCVPARSGRPGFIRIGYAVEAPYAFLTPDGELTGESPEVAKRITSRLGIPRITWRQVEFASLIDELDAGRIDMIASGMFVTEERARRVAFSIPTFHTHQALLVRAGNPGGCIPTARQRLETT